MTATVGPSSNEEAKKQKKREAEQAKKARAEAEEAVLDAVMQAELAKLDMELIGVETAGLETAGMKAVWADNVSPEYIAAQIAKANADARVGYAQRFQIDGRGKAGWAARKIAEARTALEDAKAILRAEVNRADREFEGRKAFFEEKILAWAEPEPKDKGTQGSIRFPTHGVRVEVRDDSDPKVVILDEKTLLEEILETFGISEASGTLDDGGLDLVRLTPQLNIERVKQFLLDNPELPWNGAAVQPATPGRKKLVVVRLSAK